MAFKQEPGIKQASNLKPFKYKLCFATIGALKVYKYDCARFVAIVL